MIARESTTQDGFTLVEMLVSLALLAILAGYAISSVSTFRQIKQVEDQLDDRQSVRAVRLHFEQVLSNARVVFEQLENAETQLAFKGGEHEITVVSRLDDRLIRGGMFSLHYRLGAGGQLVLEHRVFRSNRSASGGSVLPLIEGVAQLQLSYWGSATEGDAPNWSSRWVSTTNLPQKIKVDLGFAKGDRRAWPPLIVIVETAR